MVNNSDDNTVRPSSHTPGAHQNGDALGVEMKDEQIGKGQGGEEHKKPADGQQHPRVLISRSLFLPSQNEGSEKTTFWRAPHDPAATLQPRRRRRPGHLQATPEQDRTRS